MIMDSESETSEVGTKSTRKISSQGKRPFVGRKISYVMLASDAFRDVIHQRGTRKVSNAVYNQFSEEKLHSTKMNKMVEKMENTYKLEPDRTFPYTTVREIIADALSRHLGGMEYDERESAYKAKLISDDIKAKVKALNICRFKIICVVHIGCDHGQEIRIVSRALWNPQIDTFATSHFKSGKLFAVGTVYGVYFE